jgi:hypothetical protein
MAIDDALNQKQSLLCHTIRTANLVAQGTFKAYLQIEAATTTAILCSSGRKPASGSLQIVKAFMTPFYVVTSERWPAFGLSTSSSTR